MVAGLDAWKELLGANPQEIRPYFRSRKEKDFVLWTSKRVNIPVIIEAVKPLVIRHNDPEEVFSLDIEVPGQKPRMETVPAIIGTKVAGELRRRMHQILREAYKNWPDNVNKAVESELPGEAYKNGYECSVTVNVKQDRQGLTEYVVPGYCKRCPACALMGYAVETGGDVNAISRVDKDTFYAPVTLAEAIAKITRNKVDDVTFTTGQALFELNTIRPGTLFLGVIVLRDVTPDEALFTLKAIAEMERIGAAKTVFGGIKTYIPAVVFSHGRVLTGYELAGEALASNIKGRDAMKSFVLEKVRAAAGKYPVVEADIAETMRRLTIEELKDVILEAWRDAAARRRIVKQLASRS